MYDDYPDYDDPSVLIEYRILHRSGPGDTYKVVQRRVPVEDRYYMNAAELFATALADIDPTTPGQYLVQNIADYTVRQFLVKVEPVITEL